MRFVFDLHPSDSSGLLDTLFAASDESQAARGRRLRIPAWLVYPIIVVLSVWTFGYISGLFPYLGRYERSDHSSSNPFVSTGNPIGTLSLPYAYLFKGQTLFIDYDVQQEGRVDLTIYLTRRRNVLTGFGPYSYATIKESGKGRLTYTVPVSGFYDISPSPMGSLSGYKIHYQVTWGAVWADGLGGLPEAPGPVQQMPPAKDTDPEHRLLPSLEP
jgi:hypothetical protein